MPRAKNPINDLAAHRAKRADLDAREEQLKRDAAEYLGGLMMKAGLDTWPEKTLREVISLLAKEGVDGIQSKLLERPVKRRGQEGANATLQAAE